VTSAQGGAKTHSTLPKTQAARDARAAKLSAAMKLVWEERRAGLRENRQVKVKAKPKPYKRRPCGCGCGHPVRGGNQYLRGHNRGTSKEAVAKRQRAIAYLDAQLAEPTVVRCNKCGWAELAPAAECSARFAAHECNPDAPPVEVVPPPPLPEKFLRRRSEQHVRSRNTTRDALT